VKLVTRGLALSALLALGLPMASADAGTAGAQDIGYNTALQYTANAGETNDVSITGSGGTYTVHDTAGVTPSTDCVGTDATTATCTGYFTVIKIATSDKTDTVHVQADINATINGGGGNDLLYGGTENDRLIGGPGADVMSGGGGPNDVADYTKATDPVTVTLDGVANDGLSGEDDNVSTGVEGVWGGSGNDSLTGNANKNFLIGFGGDDSVSGLGAADGLNGGDGNDHLLGGGGADTFYAGAGDDTLSGGGGDDELSGDLGNNHLSGGAGDDTLYSDFTASVDTDTCGGGADSAEVDASDTVASDCESVTLV